MRNFKIILLVIILIVLAVGSYFLFGNYSDGYRAGTMVKFSRKGFVFKTFEGELNLGMILNDDPNHQAASVASIWHFSVPASDEETVKTIEQALLTGKRVKLHYNQKFFKLFWRGDTEYFVDEAELQK